MARELREPSTASPKPIPLGTPDRVASPKLASRGQFSPPLRIAKRGVVGGSRERSGCCARHEAHGSCARRRLGVCGCGAPGLSPRLGLEARGVRVSASDLRRINGRWRLEACGAPPAWSGGTEATTSGHFVSTPIKTGTAGEPATATTSSSASLPQRCSVGDPTGKRRAPRTKPSSVRRQTPICHKLTTRPRWRPGKLDRTAERVVAACRSARPSRTPKWEAVPTPGRLADDGQTVTFQTGL